MDYVIAIEDQTHDTLFYVTRNRWSPEYFDAFKFKQLTTAENHLRNLKRMNPDNDRYQRAYVR